MTQVKNKNLEISTYKLSIQVSLNGLSFCVTNSKQELLAIIGHKFEIKLTPNQLLDKIKHLIDNDPKLQYNFNNVEIIHQNELYSFVPKALFEKDLLQTYLHYNIKVLNNDFIAYDELDQHEMIVVYIPYTNVNNFFFDTFGAFTYKHHTSVLLENLLLQEKNSSTTKVFVHMNCGSFDIVVFKKGKMIFTNSFHYETKEDFLYYIMFTAEQLNLNPENFNLIFLGNIQESSDYYQLTYKYIRNITFGNNPYSFVNIEENTTIASHEHFVLLSHF